MVKKAGARRKKADKAKTQFKTSKKGIKIAKKGLNEVKPQVQFKTLIVDHRRQKQQQQLDENEEDVVDRPLLAECLALATSSVEEPGEKAKTEEEEQKRLEWRRKKLKSFKELLGKLSHHTHSIRLEGLKGLTDHVLLQPKEKIRPELWQLLPKAMALCWDLEAVARKQATAFLVLLFTKFPSSDLTPFHEPVGAHLGCALSHLDPLIQKDGLRLVDAMLQSAPELLASPLCLDQVLPNCLRSISAANGNHQKLDSALGRVELLLKVAEDVRRRGLVEDDVNVVTSLDELREEGFYPFKNVHRRPGVSLRDMMVQKELLLSRIQGKPPPSLAAATTTTTMTTINHNSHTSLETLATFGRQVVPLLFNTWVEVAPLNSSKARASSSTAALSKDNAKVLERLVGLIRLLMNLLDSGEAATESPFSSPSLLSKFTDLCVAPLPFCALDSKGGLEEERLLSKINANIVLIYLKLIKTRAETTKMADSEVVFDFFQDHYPAASWPEDYLAEMSPLLATLALQTRDVDLAGRILRLAKSLPEVQAGNTGSGGKHQRRALIESILRGRSDMRVEREIYRSKNRASAM